jgi:hypothetical protein
MLLKLSTFHLKLTPNYCTKFHRNIFTISGCCIFHDEYGVPTYNLFQNQKSTNSAFLPQKYNRQRRRLLFLVCLQAVSASVRKKWDYERKLLVVVHCVFYSHFGNLVVYVAQTAHLIRAAP